MFVNYITAKRDNSRFDRKFPLYSLLILAVLTVIVILTWYSNSLRATGIEYEEQGHYVEALEMYQNASEWTGTFGTDLEDCIDRVWRPAKYAEATELYKSQNYREALEIFLSLEDYGNSKTMAEKCMRAYSESN